MALSRSVWLAGARYIRFRIPRNHGPLLPRLVPSVPVGYSGFRTLFYKSPGSTMDALRIWKLMEYMGMDYCFIIRTRRRMKKYSYPWLAYCIPAALILAIGDFIAQYHLKPHASDRTFWKFLTEEWVKGETLLFALMGFFPIGYLLCKWNLFLYRKMRCHGYFSFLWKKILLDLLIISPIILSLMIITYSFFYGENVFTETWENNKKIAKERFWPALKDSMIFNILTRPPVLFGIFYLAPIHLRRMLKTIYEVIFATYVTGAIRKHVNVAPADRMSAGGIGGISKVGDYSSITGFQRPETVDNPMTRWARYKKWACRNRED
ncbi:peroxisomal membrane protein 2 [Halyomorpha halys]|uniref:peroxisomal membrane protein 2 n=1 Tax=Halyomorpha halys TaxID=286706 RepID=UPI0006D4F842|nr:uncharacterized protein LOC106681051 [Halyomorpha halys]